MPQVKLQIAVFALLGLLAFPLTAAAQAGDDPGPALRSILADHGFENLGVVTENGVVTVWFENRVYRYDMAAIGAVAYLAGHELDPAMVLELVPENRGVSLLALSAPVGQWLEFLEGRTDAAVFAEELAVDQGRRRNGGSLSFREEKENGSRFRTDLALRPLFDLHLGRADDPFEYALSVAPEATMSPFYGGLVTLQAAVRLHNDFDPCGKDNPCEPTVVPVRNTLSWGGWLPRSWLLATSAGTFPGDRYGMAAQVGKLFWDGKLELWGGGDLSGKLLFLDNVVEYSALKQWTAYAAVTHRPRGIDLETTVTVGRFREGRGAVRVDMARRLHEFEIGFFFIQSLQKIPANQQDTIGDNSIGGVTLRIPLPLRKVGKPAVVRPVTVPAFPFSYRESDEPVGIQLSQFDNLDRLRKRLYPTFILNNLEDLRRGSRSVGGEDRP